MQNGIGKYHINDEENSGRIGTIMTRESYLAALNKTIPIWKSGHRITCLEELVSSKYRPESLSWDLQRQISSLARHFTDAFHSD